MKKPKLSIILNIYNLEKKYIERAIDSIKKQKFNDYECLIIDDGSEEKFQYKNYFKTITKDNKFKYYYHKNIGIGPSRNVGVNKSKGKYIYFLDGDDYLIDDSLNYFNSCIKKYDFDVMHVNYVNITDLSKVKQLKTNEYFFNNANKGINLKFFNQIQNVKFILKKDFIIKNKLFFLENKKRHEDVYFILNIKSLMHKYLYTNKFFFIYDNIRTNSFTNSIKNNENELFIDMILESFNFLKNIKNNLFSLYVFYYINVFFGLNYKKNQWLSFFEINNYKKYKNLLSIRYKILYFLYRHKLITRFFILFLKNNKIRKFLVDKIK